MIIHLYSFFSEPNTGWAARHKHTCGGPGAVVKAVCLGSRDREFKPHSGLQVKKKSSPLTQYSVLLGASVTEKACSASNRQGSNPVSGR